MWSQSVVGSPTSGVGLSATAVLVATHDGGLTALDNTTGEVLYRATLPSAAAGAPIVRGDHVLIGTVSGDVLRLDGRNGGVVGSRRVRAPIIAPPRVFDGMLLTRTSVGVSVLNADTLSVVREVGDPSFLLPGQTTRPALLTGGTVLLHTDSGAVRGWREGATTPSWSSTSVVSSPSMDAILAPRPVGEIEKPTSTSARGAPRMAILVGGLAVGVRLLNPETGAEFWRALPGSTPVGAAVSGDEKMVALLDRRLVRLGSDGRMLSSMLLASTPVSHPLVAPGTLLVPLMGGKTELLQAGTMSRVEVVDHGGTLVVPVGTTPGFAFLALKESAVFSLRL